MRLSKLFLGASTAMVLAVAVPALGLTITTENDVTFMGGGRYNNTDPLGLFARDSTQRAYVEFDLGYVPATSAVLHLYNGWSKPDAAVNRDIQVTGGPGAFNEDTVTEEQINAIEAAGVLTTPQSVFHTDDTPRWYTLDITDFYNDHLGLTVTLALRAVGGNGDGPIFVDHEGTSQQNTASQPIPISSALQPRIEVVESTLPDCRSRVSPDETMTSTAIRSYPAAPASFAYAVENLGSNPLYYTAIESDDQGNQTDYTWLSLDPSSGGPIAPTASDTVTVTITDTSLAAGTHTGYITITDNCDPASSYTRRIDLTIIGCLPQIIPGGDMHRSHIEGSADPAPDVVWTVRNDGEDGLSYTVSEVVDCSWLSLNKTEGGPLDYNQTDSVTATIDPAGLAGGKHSCTVRFTDNCGGTHDREVILWVLTQWDALQQFEAEFIEFTGSDAAAQSPLGSCNPKVTVPDDRKFHPTYDSTSGLTGFLTQGTIGTDLTTARFWNPAGDGKRGRFRFTSFLPWDDSYQPTRGMIVAWRMKVGNYSLVRGPIQFSAPSVTGPFNGDLDTANEATCYVRLDGGRYVYILNNGGGTASGLSQPLDISHNGARNLAGEWHQWSVAAVYDGFDMTYWNLWLDGEKLYFGGTNGSVTGPGGDVYSFRTAHDGVTGTPYVGLGDLGDADLWDFEFDWVRMISLDTAERPFWDGQGCVAAPRCNTPFADADADGDVDQLDFAAFQLCVTGSNPPAGAFDQQQCECLDHDGDEDIDALDFVWFEACGSGPDVPWQPSTGCP